MSQWVSSVVSSPLCPLGLLSPTTSYLVHHCYTINPLDTAGNSGPNMTFYLSLTHMWCLKCSFVQDAFLCGPSYTKPFYIRSVGLCALRCQNVGHFTPLIHETENRCKKNIMWNYLAEKNVSVTLYLRLSCIFVVCLSLFVCRRPRSPGRGGRLFPQCPRMQSGRPGVCLPKRYYSQTIHVACSRKSHEGKTDISRIDYTVFQRLILLQCLRSSVDAAAQGLLKESCADSPAAKEILSF